MFKTQYTERMHRQKTKPEEWHHYYSATGDGFENEYERYVDENGVEDLRITGKTNQQEYIQSHLDSVDFDKIIARYMAGDDDALEKIHGFYADVSQIPINLQDMLNMNMRGEEMFNKLPVELKNVFHDSYYEFLTNPKLLDEYYEKLAAKMNSSEKPVDNVEKESTDEQEH